MPNRSNQSITHQIESMQQKYIDQNQLSVILLQADGITTLWLISRIQ